MKRFLIVVLALTAFGEHALAQAFVQNTMYPFARYMYNPGAAGLVERPQLMLLGRVQWAGIPGAPRLVVAAADGEVRNVGGLGAYLIRDELGPLVSSGLNASYSFHLNVGENGSKLGIGVQGGFLQRSINTVWIYRDVIDPLIGPAEANYSAATGTATLGAGLFYRHMDSDGNERFFAGLSGLDLLEPSIENLTLTPGINSDSRVPRTFYFTGGYRFYLNAAEGSYFMPSLLARTDGSSFQMDLSTYFKYKVLTLGLNFRGLTQKNGRSIGESFGFILGSDLSDRSFMGYSYDYTLSNLGINGDASSHELVFTYRFGNASGFRPNVIDPIDIDAGASFAAPRDRTPDLSNPSPKAPKASKTPKENKPKEAKTKPEKQPKTKAPKTPKKQK